MNSVNGLQELTTSKESFRQYFECYLRAQGIVRDDQEIIDLDIGTGDIIPFKLRTVKEERMVSLNLNANKAS